MTRPEVGALVALLALTLPASAQEGSRGPLERIELSGHKRLEAVRADPGARLAPFTTDGCSGGMSATWSMVARRFPGFAAVHRDNPPWEECCVVHDRAYHLGGEDPAPEASFAARLAADEALRTCVAGTVETRRSELTTQYGLSEDDIDKAYNMIAAAMFDAVRLGGMPCSGLPWRWGYGWPHCPLID